MDILIVSRNSQDRYSGGRYHGFILAYALANAGNRVTYLTNCLPVFSNDFSDYDRSNLSICISNEFRVKENSENFEAIVAIPDQSKDAYYYDQILRYSILFSAPIFLVNFESENWFNSVSPYKKDAKIWDWWNKLCSRPNVILSSAMISQRYAKNFYTKHPEHTFFDVWSPPINSVAADAIKTTKKENRVILITRLSDKHKGFDDIEKMIGTWANGYEIAIIAAIDKGSLGNIKILEDVCRVHNARLVVYSSITDKQKFELISSSKLLIFPTYFEGYGYPLLEALYFDLPVIAYDLPVLREVAENQAFFVPVGSFEQIKIVAKEILTGQKKLTPPSSNFKQKLTFYNSTLRLKNSFKSKIAQLKEVSTKSSGFVAEPKSICAHHIEYYITDDCMFNVDGYIVSPFRVETVSLVEDSSILAKCCLTDQQNELFAGLGLSEPGKAFSLSSKIKKLDITNLHIEIQGAEATTCKIILDKKMKKQSYFVDGNNLRFYVDKFLVFESNETLICGWVSKPSISDRLFITFETDKREVYRTPLADYRKDVNEAHGFPLKARAGFSGNFIWPSSYQQLSVYLLFNSGKKVLIATIDKKHSAKLGNKALSPFLNQSPVVSFFSPWTNEPVDSSSFAKIRLIDAVTGCSLNKNDLKLGKLFNKHAGRTAFLLGNGPSVEISNLEKLHSKITFGCNRLYKAYEQTSFRPTYLGSTDHQMITDFGQEMVDYHGKDVLFVSNEYPVHINGDFVWFKQVSTTPLEFSFNPFNYVMPGAGTLITFIQIGYFMGIKRFVLYGVDHNFVYKLNDTNDVWRKASGDSNHFIKNYRDNKPWAPPVKFQVEGAFLSCQAFLQSVGGGIFNATCGGKLEILPRITFEDALLYN